MNKMPDVAMTVVVVAIFADGPTTIRDMASWRVKETERMIVICTELRKQEPEKINFSFLFSTRSTGDFRLQQYKVVEMKLLAQQRELQAKIPDIMKCLDVVATLQAKKATGRHILAKPTEESDSICLWLGANVMLLEQWPAGE